MCKMVGLCVQLFDYGVIERCLAETWVFVHYHSRIVNQKSSAFLIGV